MIVVVGVDDSEQGRIAARKACRLGALLDADVHAVWVRHTPGAMLAALGGSPEIAAEFADAQRRAVWDSVLPVLEASEARTQTVDLEGYPADAIVEYAAEAGADLIVIGSRGRGDLAALVLGSTSHRVVNSASCDVLVAKGT